MIAINRFVVRVMIGGVAVASAGCRRDPSTASRSAAAYDEAQRRGEPVAEGGGGHGQHGPASPAGKDPGSLADKAAHAGHEAVPDAGQDETIPPHHEGGGSPRGQHRADGMDHAAMGHESARPSGGQAGHAGMDHAQTPAGAPPTTASHDGHGAASGTMDHAAMGHAAAPALAPSPEGASSTARPGQPARTLGADALDAPAATSVREAARSGEMAASGHTMSHGTYRHLDAGRTDVPVTSPTADPHAGHAMPSPRPKPSPKENR